MNFNKKLAVIIASIFVFSQHQAIAQEANDKIVMPTNAHYYWHQQEQIMFVCLDPCTWQGREYDNHSTELSDIILPKLDTDQWCQAALSWGAKTMLFVAKHTGGFCWWQTETTDYSVKNVAWKNGKGDLLEDLARSCQKYGLGMGIYVYTGDDTWGAGMGSGGRTQDPSKQEAYTKIYRQQLTEAITKASKYVPVTEVWFDGGIIFKIDDILAQYAPDAVCFGGPTVANSIRWVGNERGVMSSDGAWSTRDAASWEGPGSPYGDQWYPREVNTTLYDHHWFWSAPKELKRKSIEELMRVYYESVGNGTVMLLNSTPNTDGLIPDDDMIMYKALGKEIERRFGNPLASTSGRGTTYEMTFANPTKINHVILQEEFKFGERILEFVIEGFSEGSWSKLFSGDHVGAKRIVWFKEKEVSRVKVTIPKSKALPLVKNISAFYVEGFTSKPEKPLGREWEQCGSWNGDGEATVELDIDLKAFIDEPGLYLVELRKTDADAKFTIGSKQLYQSGQISPDEMLIIDNKKKNVLHLTRTAVVTDEADIRLKINLLSCKGKGVMLIKKE